MSADLAVIEAALKAATRGPWMAIGDRDDYLFRGDVATAGDPGERMVICEHAGIDAHLIANAPTWLAELVERVKVAEAAIERVRRFANNARRDYAHISGCGGDPECPACWAHDILRALDGDAKRCTSDITLRDEEHRLCRCTLTEGHAGDHDDGAGTTWTGGDA